MEHTLKSMRNRMNSAIPVGNAMSLLLMTLLLTLFCGRVSATDYSVDKSASKVKWEAKKVTGQHHGTINLANGSISASKGKIKGGMVVMDMKSIVDEDLTNPTWNKKLTDHLASKDFFSIEEFPESKMDIKKVTSVSGDTYHFQVDLTIKGITNPVEFDATVLVNGDQLKASGVITVNRAKFDIRYGSKSFFPNIGDKMIYDDFTLTFEVIAQKK